MTRRSKKRPTRGREERSAAETLRRVEAKKQRRIILLVLLVAVTLAVVVAAAVILNPAPTLPGTLVVHVYDKAFYQPPSPCPSPINTLPVNVTVTLSGPRFKTTPNVLGLVAYTNVPPGFYQVTATAAGYTLDSENATLTSGNTVHVCLALSKTG